MKTRFNTYDIVCMITELQRLVGMRVNQVYDIDNRTYVIRLQQSEEKSILLLESGNRFHTTHFEWPKNVAPSGFTMKLRKHLKNKRLEKLSQLGIDRIVDLQFGSGEAAYHIILELYDRGNIVLTDCNWTILNVLRPHVEGDKVRFAVKEKYPLDRPKTSYEAPSSDALKEILSNSKPADNLKKILNPHLEYGSSIIDHVLLEHGLAGNMKVSKEPGKGFYINEDVDKLATALKHAEKLMDDAKQMVSKGYISQKKQERPNPEGTEPSYLITNIDFHPMLYHQIKDQPYTEYETFDRAVDEYFSAAEGQKIDMKTVQIEREAMKKLTNVRNDHEKRVTSLTQVQVQDRRAAELIARNEPIVEQTRTAIQAAIANQMSWDDIKLLVKTAQDNNDPVASCIKNLKLNTNHITLLLTDPYSHAGDTDSGNEGDTDSGIEKLEPMMVDIDLSLTAFANARRYYDQKRSAAKKQQKTLESAGKALKSAERKTKQTLKEAHTVSNIIKARRTYWFEKFYWFISSDNYLVIAGRDQQQNELLVKRYMRASDIYVHAEVSGASSVVVKNPAGGGIPPRTLAEAGQAAVAYSVAWEAKVLTRAWWVHANQVSKSAPTGEYLGTGSFMIRGKKNYLLCDHLSFGFSFMFRLEDSCIDKHRDERKPLAVEDAMSEVTSTTEQEEDQEILVSDDNESEKDDDAPKRELPTISEESPAHKSLVETKNQQNIGENQIKLVQTNDDIDKLVERKEVKAKDEEKSVKQNGDVVETQDRGDEVGNEVDDSDASSDDGFPDTHVNVDHGTGEVTLRSKARTISEASDKSDDKPLSFPSLPKKGAKNPPKKQEQKKREQEEKAREADKKNKRGKHGKMKKIKEKYKDQDEEDRALALAVSQAAKEEKEAKNAQKKAGAKGKTKASQRGPKTAQPAPIIMEAESDGEEQDPEAEQAEQQGPDADAELLSQLTGSPFTEDELLFAVPVVAPYSTLNNYKYKVKLTPGTSKRGKAAKTAVQVFLRDKNATSREKDLLKAVKEENVARNFPGKVKLSAPQLHKHKK